MDSFNASVIQALEKRVKNLERQKLRLAVQKAQNLPPEGRFEEFVEHILKFFASYCNISKKEFCPEKDSAETGVFRAASLLQRKRLSNRQNHLYLHGGSGIFNPKVRNGGPNRRSIEPLSLSTMLIEPLEIAS